MKCDVCKEKMNDITAYTHDAGVTFSVNHEYRTGLYACANYKCSRHRVVLFYQYEFPPDIEE